MLTGYIGSRKVGGLSMVSFSYKYSYTVVLSWSGACLLPPSQRIFENRVPEYQILQVREYPTTICKLSRVTHYNILKEGVKLVYYKWYAQLCIVFWLKVMISSCQHFYDNLSFTGILNRLIFDRVYDSWIFSSVASTNS